MRCIIDLRQQNFNSEEIYGAKHGKRMIVKLCGAVREELKNRGKKKKKLMKILNTEINRRQGQNEKWVTVSKGETDKEEEEIK